MNELLLRSLIDKTGVKHNEQNFYSFDKKGREKKNFFDDKSFNISQTTHSKFTNSSDNEEPTKKKEGKIVEL